MVLEARLLRRYCHPTATLPSSNLRENRSWCPLNYKCRAGQLPHQAPGKKCPEIWRFRCSITLSLLDQRSRLAFPDLFSSPWLFYLTCLRSSAVLAWSIARVRFHNRLEARHALKTSGAGKARRRGHENLSHLPWGLCFPERKATEHLRCGRPAR